MKQKRSQRIRKYYLVALAIGLVLIAGFIFFSNRLRIGADTIEVIQCSERNLSLCTPLKRQEILATVKVRECNEHADTCPLWQKVSGPIVVQFYTIASTLDLTLREFSQIDPNSLEKICEAEKRSDDIAATSSLADSKVKNGINLEAELEKCKGLKIEL